MAAYLAITVLFAIVTSGIAMPNSQLDMRKRVLLNVGGTKYETSSTTLLSHQSAFFDCVLSEQWVEAKVDEIFIDRDGKLFRHILNFMRASDRGKQSLVDNLSTAEKALLREEAEYFQLLALVDLLGKPQQTAGFDFRHVRVHDPEGSSHINDVDSPLNFAVLHDASMDGWKLVGSTYVSGKYGIERWEFLLSRPSTDL